MAAIVDTLQVRPESALYRILTPDWMWGLPEMLLAAIADAQHLQLWVQAGGKRHNRPKPIPRPGIAKPERVGHKMSIADMNEFLGWEVSA